MTSIDAGARLGDRYRLTDRIATGGMGEVWRARDELLDRDVAVKLLKAEYADDAGFVERFRNEARHTAGLAHPGIAGVFDYGEAAGTAYLVMELVPGEPLSALLAREGRLSADETLDLVTQVARALEAAHQGGVIHRDVKPGNILVCPDGTVKVTDFGIARAADAVPLTQTGTVMGTAHYLSPEQGNGRPVTPASDVYSLGVVAYECLAGQRPFDGNTPVNIAMAHLYDEPPMLPPDVPAEVSDLVAQALAKEPDDRFASAAAFAKAAEVVRAGLSGTVDAPTVAMAVPATTTLPVVRRRRSRRTLWVALAGALLLAVAAAAWALTRPAPEHPVPKVVGFGQRAAVAALEAKGFEHTETTRPSTTVKKGFVMSQDPGAGVRLREGGTVRLVISSGPAAVTMPANLVGKNVADVQRTLRALGLNVVTRPVIGLRSDTVVAVEPSTGLHVGDTVTVTYERLPLLDTKKHGKGEHGD